MPHRVVDPELVKEVVENYAIGVEGGARVKALRRPPGEKLLYVLGSDIPGVGFGCRMFGEEFEYVFVLLVSEGFTERLDVFEERFDGFLKREGLIFIARTREFEAAFFGAKFEAFAFLGFQRLGRSDACSRALSPAVLSPFDDAAAGAGGPLDSVQRVARERDVSPAVSGLYLLRDIDAGHRSALWQSGMLRSSAVNILLKLNDMWQPDL